MSVPGFLPDHPTVTPTQKIQGSIMATSTREDEERTSKFAAVLKHGAHTQAPLRHRRGGGSDCLAGWC